MLAGRGLAELHRDQCGHEGEHDSHAATGHQELSAYPCARSRVRVALLMNPHLLSDYVLSMYVDSTYVDSSNCAFGCLCFVMTREVWCAVSVTWKR